MRHARPLPPESLASTAGERLQAVVDKTIQFAEERKFAGNDPYDALSSRLRPLLKSARSRQIATQLNARVPFFPHLLRVPSSRMAKALAIFALGLKIESRSDDANRLIDDLLTEKGRGPWGYEFDVQTRWSFYPSGTPNIIVTAYVLRSLAALGRLHEVSDAVHTWLSKLHNSKGYFQYTTLSTALIFNANLLAAESATRLGILQGEVEQSVETTRAGQRSDGSWPYGTGSNLAWTDSFHTAFNLESLKYISTGPFPDAERLYTTGVRYWLDQCFSANGRPRYYAGNDKRRSHDIHNISTAVGLLAQLDLRSDQVTRLRIAATRYLLQFQRPDGSFRSTYSPPYMRWNQAHAYLALCRVRALATEVQE